MFLHNINMFSRKFGGSSSSSQVLFNTFFDGEEVKQPAEGLQEFFWVMRVTYKCKSRPKLVLMVSKKGIKRKERIRDPNEFQEM